MTYDQSARNAFPQSTFEISERKRFSPVQIHSIRNCADFPHGKVSSSFELQTNAKINPVYLIYRFKCFCQVTVHTSYALLVPLFLKRNFNIASPVVLKEVGP